MNRRAAVALAAAAGVGLAALALRRWLRSRDERETVRKAYAATARGEQSCCLPQAQSAHAIGYSDADRALGDSTGANLGLGCGTPVELAALQEGETVVDLGSGAGLDCILSAKQVGPAGRVVGVDMTDEMLAKARDAAAKAGVSKRVDFRKGTLEA